MKKYMLASLVLLMVGGEVSAQVYYTIHRRSPNYYYTEWYDEDSVFYVPYPPYRPGTTFTIRMCFYDVAGVGNLYQGIDHYTPRIILLHAVLSVTFTNGILGIFQSICISISAIW